MSEYQEPTQTAALGHSLAVRAQRDERRVKVAAMLVAHTSERQMARLLDVSQSTVSRDVKVVRRYWHARAALSYGTLVAEEVGKLDELERTFAPLARQGDDKAAQQLRWIMDRRSKLLGLDKPTRSESKVTLEHTTVLDADIERLMVEMQTRETVSVDDAAG